MHRPFRGLATGLIVAMLAAPAAATPMRTWTYGDKTSTFTVGGVTLTFAQGHDQDGAAVPGVQIRSPNAAPYTIVGENGFTPPSAVWTVAKFDRSNPVPQVMFSSFTGGAHCCNHIFIAEKLADGWTAFDLGMFDGDPPRDAPADVDGDGILDIALVDQRFLYAFDAYSNSLGPPVIINLSGGKVQDVTKAPRYRKVYERWMKQAESDCASRSNGLCAGYVAGAARAGRFDEAWKFMLAHYDPDAKWDLPGRCAGKTVNGECKGRAIKPKDFPQSLRWFLEDNGYIARKP